MKLLFFGTPDFAVPTLDALYKSNHDVLCIVTSPDHQSGRGLKINSPAIKKRAEGFNLPILQPKNLCDEIFISTLRELKPDIYVVVAYKVLPQSLLKIPIKGAINLHASLLPKYRGAAPVNHAILNGESETGVTTFLLQNKEEK